MPLLSILHSWHTVCFLEFMSPLQNSRIMLNFIIFSFFKQTWQYIRWFLLAKPALQLGQIEFLLLHSATQRIWKLCPHSERKLGVSSRQMLQYVPGATYCVLFIQIPGFLNVGSFLKVRVDYWTITLFWRSGTIWFYSGCCGYKLALLQIHFIKTTTIIVQQITPTIQPTTIQTKVRLFWSTHSLF